MHLRYRATYSIFTAENHARKVSYINDEENEEFGFLGFQFLPDQKINRLRRKFFTSGSMCERKRGDYHVYFVKAL